MFELQLLMSRLLALEIYIPSSPNAAHAIPLLFKPPLSIISADSVHMPLIDNI